MVEYGSMSLPQTQPVNQSPVPSANQAIGKQGGALRPWFGQSGKSAEPADRPDVTQGLRQSLNDPVFCRSATRNQDQGSGRRGVAELPHSLDYSFYVRVERHGATMRFPGQ